MPPPMINVRRARHRVRSVGGERISRVLLCQSGFSGCGLPLRVTQAATVTSPVTFSTVRHISSRRSTPQDDADPLGGDAHRHQAGPSPAERSARNARRADAERIEHSTTVICPSDRRWISKNCARNRTVIPSYSAVPFWFSVEPSVQDEAGDRSAGFPAPDSATRRVVGRVALLEDVRKRGEHHLAQSPEEELR